MTRVGTRKFKERKMKLKLILLTALSILGLTAATMAQVPNYVPTNGLVGWWPFNGNANDESSNGNDGIPNNVTYTTDRDGNPVSASLFEANGGNLNDNISYINLSGGINITSNFTCSFWIFHTSIAFGYPVGFGINNQIIGNGYGIGCMGLANDPYTATCNAPAQTYGFGDSQGACFNVFYTQTTYSTTTWEHVVLTRNGSQTTLYINGIYNATSNLLQIVPINNLVFGRRSDGWFGFNGKLDDIGIWNRALTEQEITELYNAVNCANNTTISPQTNSLTTGNIATFAASTSDPNPSYVWQSNFGQGFQTLNNFGNYSGANSSTLNISNVQLSEHNQPIRVISTSGECIDTSNIAIINITDTCIVTINDTITTLISVTDTLVINTLITGLTPPNNLNTIKVFPNPTNDHITIDYGNFASLNGYQLKIINSLSQQAFQTNINQQSNYLNLTTWGGNGLYFVQIIDPQGNIIDIRKIVLQ